MAADPLWLEDVADGGAVRLLLKHVPHLAEEPRNLILSLCSDPFQPFEDDSLYSCGPIKVSAINLPPYLRNLLSGGAVVIGVLPGSSSKTNRPNPQYILEILRDEVLFLRQHGFMVYDEFKQEDFMKCFPAVISCH